MTFKFAYTRLLVSNFKACFQFYRDIMEFPVTFGAEDDVYADFNTGEVTLALFDRLAMAKAVGTDHLPVESPAQDKMCLCFVVDDVDAKYRELKSKAIALIAEPNDKPDWGIRVAHFRDPDGNLIEINQPLRSV